MPPALASSCFIFTRVEHRIATLTLPEDALGWVQSGAKTLGSPGSQQDFQPGELFLAARGVQWEVINRPAPGGRYQALIFQFSPELLVSFQQRYGEVLLRSQPVQPLRKLALDAELEECLLRTHRYLQQQSGQALQEHRLLEILLLLADRGYHFAPGGDLRWDDRVRRLISQNLTADWTLARLAAHFALSESSLRRRLQACNTTASEILRETRLQTGLSLLQCTELSIGEIASRCGYESHSRFSAAFRQRFDFPPSHLRPVLSLTG